VFSIERRAHVTMCVCVCVSVCVWVCGWVDGWVAVLIFFWFLIFVI